MARMKCWYKNIKAGDVLEVKFKEGHLFHREKEIETTLVEITFVHVDKWTQLFSGYLLNGRLSNLGKLSCCIADFKDGPRWDQVEFLRKVKE